MKFAGGTANVEFVSGSDPGGLETVITSTTNYNEKLVKRIDFKNGYVEFNRNTPRKDVSVVATGTNNSLDEIRIYNSKGNLVKKIRFNHDYFISTPFVDDWAHYRLKLNGFVESDAGMLDKKEYRFDYNDLVLPKYGSYSIDYWGYYNEAGNGSSLIPATTVYAEDINWVSFAKLITMVF